MSNPLLSAAIAAPPPRLRPPEPTPSVERMLTDSELATELRSMMPAYRKFSGSGYYFSRSAVLTNLAGDNCRRIFGTGRLDPEARHLPFVSDAHLRLQVVAKTILSDTRRFEMRCWEGRNECGTTHCIAGWARALCEVASADFYVEFGHELTGLALLGPTVAPHFYDTNEQALAFLESVER